MTARRSGSKWEDPERLVDGVVAGESRAVARLITMVEQDGSAAAPLLAALHRHTGRAYVLGITGAPGAGKSTLTDVLISAMREGGDQVGVLAIDPSSPLSGGALLGDRVRMSRHSTDSGVFIRSMATRGRLGGLAQATPLAAKVLDAAGKAWVIVETVGVGQVEIDIAAAADTTVVVLNPGWGDGIQVAKAGLLEIADVFVINKADREGLAETRRELEMELHHRTPSGAWLPPVVETVATTGAGVGEVLDAVAAHRLHLKANGGLARRRAERHRREVGWLVEEQLRLEAGRLVSGPRFDELVGRVAALELDPYSAAMELFTQRGADQQPEGQPR